MATSGYIPTQSTTKRKKHQSSYCATFKAWKGGDDDALGLLLVQGYDRLFMPKAERIARELPPVAANNPKCLLDRAWYTIATGRDHLDSFSHLLLHLQVTLEREAGSVRK